jgi:hypothetical protein
MPKIGNFLFVIGNENSADLTQKVVNLAYTSKIAKAEGFIAPGKSNYFLSGVFTRSDNGLLWYLGKKAVFFTDGANSRNKNYHKPSDLPETLNKDFLIANTKLIASTVAYLAEKLK